MNILKKTGLLLLLIVRLFYQLTRALVLFLYKCIPNNSHKRVIFVICFTALFTTLFFTFNETFAGDKKNKIVSEKIFKPAFINSNKNLNEQKLLAKNTKNITVDTIEKDLLNIETISYQAIEVETKLTKPEGPFASSFVSDGESMMEVPQDVINSSMTSCQSGCPLVPPDMKNLPGIGLPTPEKKLSKAELEKIKAEEKRKSIYNALENEVSLKGIVADNKNKKVIAILEISNPSGSKNIKTVSSKEVLWLASCKAIVTGISRDKVVLSSDGITVNKYLPEISDDVVMNPTTSSSSGNGSKDGGLVPPPLPGQNRTPVDKGQSMSDIDKLLNSF